MKSEIELSERLRKACESNGITELYYVAQDDDGRWFHFPSMPSYNHLAGLWDSADNFDEIKLIDETLIDHNQPAQSTLMQFVTPKIEAGKRYWRRDGGLTNPIELTEFGHYMDYNRHLTYFSDGRYNQQSMTCHDLIAEYQGEEKLIHDKDVNHVATAYFAPSIASRDEFMDERVRPKTTQETDPLGFGDDISVTHHLDPDKFSVKAIRQDDRIEIVVTEKKTLV